MPKSRNYCAVYGCMSQKVNQDLSFFSLPKEEERRRTWLELIDRSDLLTNQTKSLSHVVCSLHFDKSVIKYIPQLKPNAVPTKCLPNQLSSNHNTNTDCKNESTQTTESFVKQTVTNKGSDKKPSYVQTPTDNTGNNATQTAQELSSDIPRKHKLRVEHKQSQKKRRKLEHVLNKITKKSNHKNRNAKKISVLTKKTK